MVLESNNTLEVYNVLIYRSLDPLHSLIMHYEDGSTSLSND